MRGCAARPRRRLLLIALCCASVGLAACGKSSPASRPPEAANTVIVHVGHHTITRAILNHWAAVEAVLSYEYKPKQPVPPGLVPDPPAYRACATYLATLARSGHPAKQPTSAELHEQCVQKQEALERHILEILVTDYWISEEAIARHLHITAHEVDQTIASEFTSPAELREFLAITGEHPSDERFLMANQVRLAKLQQSVSPLKHRNGHETPEMADRVDESIAKLGRAMKRKWIPQTSCIARFGHSVPECSQYGVARAL